MGLNRSGKASYTRATHTPWKGITMAEQEHKHGSMDTTEQEKAFEGFVRWSAYALVIIFAALAFLALTQT